MITRTRNPMEVLEDALCKHRVLKGIALLEEKHGPDWASKIDLEHLELCDETSCVLGQLYHNAEVTDEQLERAEDSPRFAWHRGDLGKVSSMSGYTRGLIILDGPLLATRNADDYYGFNEAEIDYITAVQEMSDEELADLGVTREMVDAAAEYAAEVPFAEDYVKIGWQSLNATWTEEIAVRQ